VSLRCPSTTRCLRREGSGTSDTWPILTKAARVRVRMRERERGRVSAILDCVGAAMLVAMV